MRIRTAPRATEDIDSERPPRRVPLVAGAVFAAVALLLPLGVGGLASASSPATDGPRPTIVLVHGDWADASSWSGVIARLQHRGYTVVAPPNPLRGPASDAAYLASFLETISAPIVLVAHTYGGFVITNAATGNANVKALVYVDAFVPDEGQTLVDLAAGSCVDAATSFDAVPVPGGLTDVYLRQEPNPPYPGFAECFANGVRPDLAAMLAARQRPASLNQYGEPSGPPAWKAIPAWSLIGTADRVITPDQQRTMSTNAGAHISTVDAGHLSLVTRPKAVTKIIETAVRATT
jgi:pimeloyl-ACP methyl ester carboxylesterase